MPCRGRWRSALALRKAWSGSRTVVLFLACCASLHRTLWSWRAPRRHGGQLRLRRYAMARPAHALLGKQRCRALAHHGRQLTLQMAWPQLQCSCRRAKAAFPAHPSALTMHARTHARTDEVDMGGPVYEDVDLPATATPAQHQYEYGGGGGGGVEPLVPKRASQQSF